MIVPCYVDADGSELEPPQETPQGSATCKDQHILFDHKIALRTSLEELDSTPGVWCNVLALIVISGNRLCNLP